MNDFLATSFWLSLVFAFVGGLISSRWIFGPTARALPQPSKRVDDARALAQDMHGQITSRESQGLPLQAVAVDDIKPDGNVTGQCDRNPFLQDGIDLGLWPIGQVKK